MFEPIVWSVVVDEHLLIERSAKGTEERAATLDLMSISSNYIRNRMECWGNEKMGSEDNETNGRADDDMYEDEELEEETEDESEEHVSEEIEEREQDSEHGKEKRPKRAKKSSTS